jgi:2-desacetyl-2-hydroxyethyl bacteriochlorophyllide A dehydrogenase
VIQVALYYLGNRRFESGEEKEAFTGADEVRIKVHYCGICGTDYHIAKGDLDARIAEFPRVIGHEASGEIVDTVENVSDWKVGDRVVVRPLAVCGTCEECKSGNENVCRNVKYLGIEGEGAFQKLWTVDKSILHRCPDNVDFKEAALVEPLAVCAHAIKRSEIKPGEAAVVIGGGPIGIMTALLLKEKNVNVLVSEIDSGRRENCSELGIDTVNPAETDLSKKVDEITGSLGVTVVFEASGSQAGLDVAPGLIKPNGRLVTIATYSRKMELDIRQLHYRQIKLVTTRAYQKDDFEYVLSLMEQKKLPAERLITKVVSLGNLKEFLEKSISGNTNIKVLVDCRTS